MEATSSNGPREWVHALAGSRAFGSRHYLVVFLPLAAVSVLTHVAAGRPAVGEWTALAVGSTAAGWLAYLALGRAVARIRRTTWRAAAALVAYGVAGLVRGLVLAAFAGGPLDLSRATTRTLWNLLAGLVLLSAVAIADRALAEVRRLRPGADLRRGELFRLISDAFERITVPLAAVMALCVAVLHEPKEVETIGVATLVSGMTVATATTAVLVPLVAAACRRLSPRLPAALHATVISIGLLLIGAAAAWGDSEVDRAVLPPSDLLEAEILIPRTMLAALIAGWSWMVILGLGSYAEVLRAGAGDETRSETRVDAAAPSLGR